MLSRIIKADLIRLVRIIGSQRFRRAMRIVLFFYIVAVIILILAGYFELKQEQTTMSIETRDVALHADIEELRKQLKESREEYKSAAKAIDRIKPDHLDAILKLTHSLESSSKDEISTLVSKIPALEQTTSQLLQELKGIRAALNPTNPEELLQVIRLRDQFEILKHKLIAIEDKIENSEKDTEEKIQATSQQLATRLDGLIDVLMWFGFLIIPGVLYFFLGDIFGISKREKKERNDPPRNIEQK